MIADRVEMHVQDKVNAHGMHKIPWQSHALRQGQLFVYARSASWQTLGEQTHRLPVTTATRPYEHFFLSRRHNFPPITEDEKLCALQYQ